MNINRIINDIIFVIILLGLINVPIIFADDSCLNRFNKIMKKQQEELERERKFLKYSIQTTYYDTLYKPILLNYIFLRDKKVEFFRNEYFENYQDDSVNITILHKQKLISIMGKIDDTVSNQIRVSKNYFRYYHDTLVKYCNLIDCNEINNLGKNYLEVILQVKNNIDKPLGNSIIYYYYDLKDSSMKGFSIIYPKEYYVKETKFIIEISQNIFDDNPVKIPNLKMDIYSNKFIEYKIIDLRKKIKN